MTDLHPDIVLVIRRDGVLLEHISGHGTSDLTPAPGSIGQRLESVWPEAVAACVKQLVRRAIAERSTTEGTFHHGCAYHARVSAQGPDRAICIVRASRSRRSDDPRGDSDQFFTPRFDSRGFLRRFKRSIATAALREIPQAVAVIQIGGIKDIARLIGNAISEQVMGTAVQRLLQAARLPREAEPPWYMGPLSEDLLALVLETADRDAIDACVTRVCHTLGAPVRVGDASFSLTAWAGVAILGRGAASPTELLDHARASAAEAQHGGTATVRFSTDTLRLRSLARLDIACELREAIADRAIGLHYVGRHDLTTGKPVARVGYLRWRHPLRGDVQPADFVSVAEATGLALSLSRSALECLRADYAALAAAGAADLRISFGALRHHVLHEGFIADIERFIDEGAIPAEHLELRIAERTFIVRDPAVFRPLQDRGVHLVVDEVGRGMTSLDRLAQGPLWGLQLDRSWATAIHHDPIALKVCRAGIGVATALGLTPIATGIDDPAQRAALLALGCRHGMGDLYLAGSPGTLELPDSAFA